MRGPEWQQVRVREWLHAYDATAIEV